MLCNLGLKIVTRCITVNKQYARLLKNNQSHSFLQKLFFKFFCGFHIFSKVSQLVGVYGWLRNPLRCPTKKWDTCGTEETLTLSLILSIMVTTEGNKNDAPGSSLTSNSIKSKENSWAERVDEFSSTLQTNNAFLDDDGTRFFVIKRKEGDFSKTSPFLIEKAIQSVVGNAKSIKKLRSGELLTEVQNYGHATKLKKIYPTCKHTNNSQCSQNSQ